MLMAEALCRASRFPEKPALEFEGIVQTWSTIRDRVSRIAGSLRGRLGLNEEDRICMLGENCAAFFELYLAAPWAGLIMTSLNTRWSLAEMLDVLRDCEPAALVIGKGFESFVPEFRATIPSIRYVIAGEAAFEGANILWEDLAIGEEQSQPSELPANRVSYIFYTSGATGRAKGVMLSEENLFAASLAMLCTGGIERMSHVVVTVPLFHMSGGGLVRATVAAAGGMTLMRRFDAQKSLQNVVSSRASHIVWVPTMLSMVLETADIDSYDLSGLKRILYGSAPMPEALLRRAISSMPGVGFTQYYGMTETSGTGVSLPPNAHTFEGSNSAHLRAAGFPVPGVEVRIVRPGGEETNSGEPGEIQFRGPIVMLGYWRNAELTKAVRDGSWLRSGDVGYFDQQGYLFVSDRLKDMIISGGENVYSTEVENVVTSHHAVRECAVVGTPDAKWGEVVTAVVSLIDGQELELSALQIYCRERLSAFKIPRRLIVASGALPKNAAGKIDKASIRLNLGEHLLDRSPA